MQSKYLRLDNGGEATVTGIYLGDVKTSKSKRWIPLGEKAKTALCWLKAYQESQIEALQCSPSSYNSHGFVLCTSDGRYVEPKNFEKYFKVHIQACGIEHINIHATRHTFATRAMEENPEDLATLSEILGHAKISTTLDMYSHAFDEKKRRMMSSF